MCLIPEKSLSTCDVEMGTARTILTTCKTLLYLSLFCDMMHSHTSLNFNFLWFDVMWSFSFCHSWSSSSLCTQPFAFNTTSKCWRPRNGFWRLFKSTLTSSKETSIWLEKKRNAFGKAYIVSPQCCFWMTVCHWCKAVWCIGMKMETVYATPKHDVWRVVGQTSPRIFDRQK